MYFLTQNLILGLNCGYRISWEQNMDVFGFIGSFGQIWRLAAALLCQPFKKRRQNILIFTEINCPWYKDSEKHSH